MDASYLEPPFPRSVPIPGLAEGICYPAGADHGKEE